jgi:hypothetical protein
VTARLDVDGLQVSATPEWTLAKWDEARPYRDGLERCVPNSKAVDLVGCKAGTLFFIEVKDFVGHHLENRARLTSSELAIEVAQKVRDSIAGIVGGARGADAQPWSALASLLPKAERELTIVLWVFVDLHKKDDVVLNTLTQDLKKRLRWLTRRIVIATEQDGLAGIGLDAKRNPATRR